MVRRTAASELRATAEDVGMVSREVLNCTSCAVVEAQAKYYWWGMHDLKLLDIEDIHILHDGAAAWSLPKLVWTCVLELSCD